MTSRFPQTLQVRWSDIDANKHVRHSAYADYAAQARIGIFREVGFGMEEFTKMACGPILFREELVYMREVGPNATICVETVVQGLSEDRSRWSMKHFIHQEGADKPSVQVIVEGAWLDLRVRKLCLPPLSLVEAMDSKLEFASDFKVIPTKTKLTLRAGE